MVKVYHFLLLMITFHCLKKIIERIFWLTMHLGDRGKALKVKDDHNGGIGRFFGSECIWESEGRHLWLRMIIMVGLGEYFNNVSQELLFFTLFAVNQNMPWST